MTILHGVCRSRYLGSKVPVHAYMYNDIHVLDLVPVVDLCMLRSSLLSILRSSVRRRAARATAKSQPPNRLATNFQLGCNLAPPAESSYVVSISANRHITMRRAYMHSYLSLLLASSYVATGRVSAFMSAYPGVTRGIVTTPPAGLAMVRNRGLEIPEEGATPLRKCLQLGCHVLHLINSLRKAVHNL